MAIDLKYGRVTLERGTIGDDEPVVVFRAKDILLPRVLADYELLCEGRGSPAGHLEAIQEAKRTVLEWQFANGAKVPD